MLKSTLDKFISLNKCSTTMMVLMLGISSSLLPTQSFANDETTSIENIKKQLINDPDFISSLSKKIINDPAFNNNNSQNYDEEKIRSIVKAYLLEQPEVMIEVQSALDQKQTQSIANFQKEYIAAHKDEIFNSNDDAIFGNPKGDITIVEFYDYNCGFCKKSFPDMMNLIKSNPNIRFIMKDFPILSEDSAKAHVVAHSFQKLMPNKYMEYHEKLLLNNGRATEEKAIELALSFGVDEKKLRALMNDDATINSLRKNSKIAYDLGINGTPSYIIGDKVISGAVGEEALLNATKN